MKSLYTVLTALVLLGLAGCATPSAPKASTLQGTAANVNKMAPQSTAVTLVAEGKNVTITFPSLQNNTGEGFAATPCQATFALVGSHENGLTKSVTHVYQGSFVANGNCALFTEQPSTTYTKTQVPRFAHLESAKEGWEMRISEDVAGKSLLIAGKVQ
ncbi:MAG: hypothetical protein IBX45_05815 [Campylobacterales bacterium]|nr:hypothetical protein [Campylobacterales bacterium]